MINEYTLKDICMAIVLYNGNSELISKIEALRDSIGEIVIIDNSDTKADFLFEIEKKENVTVISNNKNMGIAYALNQGLSFASEKRLPLLLTMDQDSRIDTETISKLLNAINPITKAVSVGPYYDKKKHEQDNKVNCLITSGNMTLVNVLNDIGGFKAELFIDCVDIDLSFNLLTKGYVLKQIAGTSMEHKIGEYEKSNVFGKQYLSHKPIRFFYKTRNNIYIQKTYFKQLPFLCIKLGLAFSNEMLKLLVLENNKAEKLKYVKMGIRQGLHFEKWNNL